MQILLISLIQVKIIQVQCYDLLATLQILFLKLNNMHISKNKKGRRFKVRLEVRNAQ